MVKCSKCSRDSVYINRLSGKAFCRIHFIEYFERKVKKNIRKYNLLKPGDKVVVAVSGGKDSLSLLHILNKINSRAGLWKLSALLIDEGIAGYREYTINDFLNYVTTYGIQYRIIRFKEVFGYTLDEMVEISRRKGLDYQPCSLCGVFRRYLLNKVSREMGASVLATAHNLDDTIQTFLINVIKNSWEKIARQGPISGIIDHPLFVKRVKPLINIMDRETTIYALVNGLIKPVFHQCPYIIHNVRFYVRRYINEIEEKYPGTKYMMLKSMLKIHNILSKHPEEVREGDLKKCIVCGEPSAHDICKACEYRFELGIMSEDENRIVSEYIGVSRKSNYNS
uniref:TIGR00269 family protein n=1 Tax=Staphylothermus marinus TaxID=2280 RepID=A0A7C4NVY3_STAMA